MTDPRHRRSEEQIAFLRELLDENAAIECTVLEIRDAWVIHGVVPFDGEVPMAVFETYEEAQRALDEVRAGLGSSTDE